MENTKKYFLIKFNYDIIFFPSYLCTVRGKQYWGRQLCAACMLLCVVSSSAVLPGVPYSYVYSYGGVNCLNSVPYRCYS